MGNAFLFKKAGKLRKNRERRKLELAQHLVPKVYELDIFAAKSLMPFDISEGSSVEVCIDNNDTIAILCDRNKIAFISNGNQKLKRQIDLAGGRMVGELVRKRQHSGILEIAIPIDKGSTSTYENSKTRSTP